MRLLETINGSSKPVLGPEGRAPANAGNFQDLKVKERSLQTIWNCRKTSFPN